MPIAIRRPIGGRRGIAGAALSLVVILTGCTSIDAQGIVPADVVARPQLTAERPSQAEIAYVEQTALVVYRRAPVERMERFLFSDSRGHGICVRAPAGAVDTADYTLLVLQRRVEAEFISQVEDDVAILRSAADAAPCRALGADRSLWRPAN